MKVYFSAFTVVRIFRDLDFEHRPQHQVGHHQAHIDDITLRTVDDFQHFDDNPFDVGPSEGIDSRDFYHVDLGIDWDGDRASSPKDDMSSLGVGRDVFREVSIEQGNDTHAEKGVISLFTAGSPSASIGHDAGVHNFDFPMFESVDLGEFGVGFDGQDVQEDKALSRACRKSSLSLGCLLNGEFSVSLDRTASYSTK